MAEEPQGERPRIIVDEDWKSQVQAEKERLRQAQQEPKPAGQPPRGGEAAGQSEMPPASFPLLLSMLATQAMVLLGQIPDPVTGAAELHLDEAQHFIDLLAMLQEKTQGNLTPEESKMLEDLLHDLRLAYVTLSRT